MSDPMWENPTEPRTQAGRRLIASFPADAADAARPEFIRHVAQSILAIEQEVGALAGHRIAEDHDCFAMDCKGLGPEVIRLREWSAGDKAEAPLPGGTDHE